MRQQRKPAFRIWIPRVPRSAGKKRSASSNYVALIRKAASRVVPCPTKSTRLDVEIFFYSELSLRADVDNVIKPILDALIGIVYEDDRQVRSVRATALPKDDAFRLKGWGRMEVLKRLMKDEPREFLIDIYYGLSTPGPP